MKFSPGRTVVPNVLSVVGEEPSTIQSQQIQLMQKAFAEMDIQLADVLSDVAGVSGTAIVRSILAGERNPDRLAGRCDHRVRATKADIAASENSCDTTWGPSEDPVECASGKIRVSGPTGSSGCGNGPGTPSSSSRHGSFRRR